MFTWIFLICITLQVFFAGLAFFMNPINWSYHESFARYFFILPLVMAALCFSAQLPRRIL
ncbi:DUF6220 domain-containing protein [Bacillus capparidis]